MVLIAVLFAFLLGCSVVVGTLSYFYHLQNLLIMWEIWAGVAGLSIIGILLSLVLIFRKRKPSSKSDGDVLQLRDELEEFEREYKQILRGHLKISILFWTFFYKREKVKSFEDARREVFSDLRKELPNIKWMEALLEEIRVELTKYK